MSASEIREIPQLEAVVGDGLTWKVAMWGTFRDQKLLAKLKRQNVGFDTFCTEHRLTVAQGLELRDEPTGITVDQTGKEAVVLDVRSGSPAEAAKILPGDRIIRINKHDPRVLGAEELTALINGSEGGKLSVVRRAGGVELELRGDKLEHHPELEGARELLFARLKNCGRIVDFDDSVMARVVASRCWVRKGRAILPMLVSRPPHLVVDATRRFTVYRDDFVVIPSRKIGINGPDNPQTRKILRALALFLNSSLALYFEFFHSSEWGIQESISTLKTLKLLPVPFDKKGDVIAELAALHERLTKILGPNEEVSDADADEIDRLVFRAAGLSKDEQNCIKDFVQIHLLMIKGKVEKDAVRGPDEHEVPAYLETLRDQLDDYMQDEGQPASHHITAVCDHQTAMIEIILREGKPAEPIVRKANETEADELKKTRARLLKKHRQWIYFDRNLRLYSKGRLYLFKPLQRIQWTKRQAILDADELIAEALGSSGD